MCEIDVKFKLQKCAACQDLPTLLHIKIYIPCNMMSFLTCITGFFMNFELLPILTDYAN